MALTGTRTRFDRVTATRDTHDLQQAAQTILRNALWLTGAQLSAGVAQFAAIVLLARHLGPLAYGHWGFAAAFVSLFSAAADFGLSTLAVRDLARDTPQAPRYLGTAACIKAVLSLVLFSCMAGIAQFMATNTETRVLIYILGAQMLLASGILLTNSVFRIHERMNIEAATRTAQALATLFVVLALIHAGAAAVGVALGYLIVTFAALCVSAAIARRSFLRERLGVQWRLAVPMLSEAWPLAVGMTATAFYYYFDSIYMGALGQGRQLGWYAAAYAPVLWIAQIVGVVRTAFLPAQSRAMAGNNDARPFLRFYAGISAALGLAVAVGGVLLAGPLLRTAYGRAYEPGTFALQMLSVTAGVMFFSSFYGSQLLVEGRQRTYLVGVAAGAAVNIGLNLFIIPRYSLDGAAVTTLVSESLVCSFMLWQRRSAFELREIPVYMRVSVGAAAVLLLVLTAGRVVLPTLGAAAVGGTAYLAIIWRCGQLDARSGEASSAAANAPCAPSVVPGMSGARSISGKRMPDGRGSRGAATIIPAQPGEAE